MAIDIPLIDGANEAVGAYLQVAEANAIAATLPGLIAWGAATSEQQAAALLQASIEIDSAMRYQGCKYALIVGTAQEREFPRVTNPVSLTQNGFPSPSAWPNVASLGNNWVWDWDATANAAVVPLAVKRACLHQANSILAGDREERLNAIHDGVTSQGADGLQEAYAQGGTGRPATNPLCRRADAIMQRYRLRSGALL